MILIAIIGESVLGWPFNPEMQVRNSLKKNKSASVTLPISQEILKLPQEDLRAFIVVKSCDAISLVEKKLKGKVDTDFEALRMAFLEAVTPTK